MLFGNKFNNTVSIGTTSLGVYTISDTSKPLPISNSNAAANPNAVATAVVDNSQNKLLTEIDFSFSDVPNCVKLLKIETNTNGITTIEMSLTYS